MKTSLLTVIVAMGLFSVSCGATKSQTNSESPREQTTPVTEQTVIVMPPSANADEYKNLLFVDQRLEELVTRYNAPTDQFVKAYQYVKVGKTDDAKKSLWQVLSDPVAEVREKLWAWRALRELGEKPPPSVANEVRGVVIEVPVDDWIDTVAAYSDSRARYLNGKSAVLIVWEAMEKNHISSLAKNLIESAKPLVGKAPIYDKHQPAKDDVVRVSVLTYGGIYILEAKASDITSSHILSPPFDAGTQLFLALFEASKKQKR